MHKNDRYIISNEVLSDLFEKMQKLKDMEKETKTITMPLSEFEDLRSKAAQRDRSEQEFNDRVNDDVEKKLKEKEDFFIDLIGNGWYGVNLFVSQWNSNNLIEAFEKRERRNTESLKLLVEEQSKRISDLIKENDSLKDQLLEMEHKIEAKPKRKFWKIWKI